MLFASRSNFNAETAVRQLEERIDAKFEMAKATQLQYLVSMEDVLDKLDHVVKRHNKRRQREPDPPDSVPEAAEDDPVSIRVAERRQNRGISA